MRKYLLIAFLALIICCKKTSEKNYLGTEDHELVKEGINVFEDMLNAYYPEKTLELSYETYFKSLVASLSRVSNNKLDSIHKFKKAILFLEKLKKKEKINIFWKIDTIEHLNFIKGIGYENELRPHIFMNTKQYLEYLKSISKTEEFRTFLIDYTEKFKDISFGVIVNGFLDSERKKVFKKDKEVFKIFVAFHVYYETILIQNL
ncbi:MAG: hypothetical protein V3V28_11500 [Polaribacter sp.]|uniref:hypothetical protein n=1 Tax=Polaribacter sp. TaxID=1920175 RepID=UPI002F35F85D